jgi:hypothetical protein
LVQTTFLLPGQHTGSSKFLKTAGAVVKEQIGGAKIVCGEESPKEKRLFFRRPKKKARFFSETGLDSLRRKYTIS